MMIPVQYETRTRLTEVYEFSAVLFFNCNALTLFPARAPANVARPPGRAATLPACLLVSAGTHERSPVRSRPASVDERIVSPRRCCSAATWKFPTRVIE